jgi:hypothetical protein
MSIFDDIVGTVGGLFTGDTYFPDNPNRLSRAKELAADISSSSYHLAAEADEVKFSLKGLNLAIETLYHQAGLAPPVLVDPSEPGLNKDFYEVSQVVAPLFVIEGINGALTTAGVAAELEAGEISGAAAAEAVGLAGIELGPAIAIAAGITAVIGAIGGSDARDKLQDYINRFYPVRLRMRASEIQSRRLVNALSGLTTAIHTLIEIDYSGAMLSEAVKRLVDGAVKTLKEHDPDEDARQQLVNLDRSRGSWTKEDPNASIKKVLELGPA